MEFFFLVKLLSQMSILAFCRVAYHSSVTKVTTLPGRILATKFYSTEKEHYLKPNNLLDFHQEITNQQEHYKNIQVIAPYLTHLYDIENNKNYLKYKWNPSEKIAMTTALNWLDKKPIDINDQDLILLSFLVKTRSPVQCRRFLQYRIRIKMIGFT